MTPRLPAPNSRRRLLRIALALLPALGLMMAAPRPAAAQCAPTDAECQAGQPPIVWIVPGDSAWSGTSATASVPVVVHWCGPYSGLDQSSAQVFLDGSAITTWTWQNLGTQQVGTQHCQQHATTSGTLSLASGTHQLYASIARANDATIVGQATATYVYTYQPPPSYGVAVSPHTGSVQRPLGAGATEVFQVTSGSNVPVTFAISATCTGSAPVGCSTSATSLTLAPNATAMVGVSYHAGATSGLTGAVKLRAVAAQAADSGTVSVTTVTAGSSGRANPIQANGIIRSDCLTVAVGEAAAYECGDLRLVHGFPGVRVMGRAYAPVLVYNSQQARPSPVIQHEYAPPAGSTPTSVTMQVCSSDTSSWCWATSTFPGWAAGESRRLGVTWDASLTPTGVYPYVVTITSTYANGSTSAPTTISGKLVLVNRSGRTGLYRWPLGWAMAGVEQLFAAPGGGWLWVGGDGSAQVYDRVDASTWVALPYDRPDTLRLVSGEYVRTLPGRAEVHFDANGRHVRTINKLGHQTTLAWTGDQLTSITLPHGLAYTFSYYSCGGQLSNVGAPGGRYTALTTDCDGRLLTVTNPGLPAVSFGYGDGTARIASRTDRRGYRTDYRYDAAFRLSAAKRWMNTAATGDSIVTRFRAQESQGLPATGGTLPQAQLYTRMDGPRLDVPDTTAFVIDRWGGPRTVIDALGHTTTLYREDTRWPGLVTRVTYPNGREVSATYDARGHPVATVDWATSLGGRYATTLYGWDAYWDAPTRVTQPEGEYTLTSYDASGRPAWIQPGPDSARRVRFTYFANGDANAPGLVQSVKEPLTLAETYGYNSLGNLQTATAPSGLQTVTWSNAVGRVDSVMSPGGAKRRMTYDAADRLVEEESFGPDRVAHSSFTEDSTYAAEHLWVHTYRNDNGQPDSVARWQTPDPAGIGRIVTHWRYDGAGRTIVEIAPDSTPATLADNPRDSTVYDPAGNATDVFTRRGFHLTMRYDTLGRLTRRITPADTIPGMFTTINWASPIALYFPYFGQDAAGNFTLGTAQQARTVIIPADTATFGYDESGNMLWANNRDARVSRTWYTNGTMASETQRIRAYADTSTHGYQLDYRYDLDGRRTGLIHPGNISPHAPARDSTGYAYDAVTGSLASVTGQATYTFAYDAAGRTQQLTRGSTHETFGFDAAGRLYARHDWSGNIEVHSDATTYDGTTGEVTQVSSTRETVRQNRRGLGALAWVDTYDLLKGTRKVEYYRTDPLANQLSSIMEGYGTAQVAPPLSANEGVVHTYEHNTGRLLSSFNIGSPDPYEFSWYDRAGNQVFRASIRTEPTPYAATTSGGATVSNVSVPLRDEQVMYYGADDRLRVVDRQSCLLFYQSGTTWACDQDRPPAYEKRSAFEEYRYDALGRRVLVRTRSEFACRQYCLNTLRRTVWDGDQVLYEISAPGGSSATAAQMEADTGLAVPFFLNQQHTAVEGFFPFGRVMYEHGGGIDAPLGVVRMEYSTELHDAQVIAPHATWRGTYDRGTPITGQCLVYSSNGKQLAPPPDSTPASGDQYGGVVGGGTYNGTKEHCIEVDWPSAYTWSARQTRRGYYGPSSWMGSLIFESRDASGLYYRRNRYYDSEKGRFTQEDPIGLAGGLNTYGYATGDPITFSDPDGLSACCYESQRQLALDVQAMEYNGTHPKETAALAGVGVLAVAGGVGILELGAASAAALPELAQGTSLAERAREIHGAVSAATQRRTTVAVARVVTAEGRTETWISSSERVLRPAQRILVRAGERAISGVGHAEQTIVNAAREAGATVEEIAASRPICSACADAIRSIGARFGSIIK